VTVSFGVRVPISELLSLFNLGNVVDRMKDRGIFPVTGREAKQSIPSYLEIAWFPSCSKEEV
jgi:hypothetical protein